MKFRAVTSAAGVPGTASLVVMSRMRRVCDDVLFIYMGNDDVTVNDYPLSGRTMSQSLSMIASQQACVDFLPPGVHCLPAYACLATNGKGLWGNQMWETEVD